MLEPAVICLGDVGQLFVMSAVLPLVGAWLTARKGVGGSRDAVAILVGA